MKKIAFFILFVGFLGQQLWADPVSKEKALQQALSFLQYSNGQMRKTFGLSSLASVSEEALQTSLANYKDNPFYVFQNEESFVIVSGDDAMPPVVGYSFNSDFTSSTMPPALKAYLEAYAAQIAEMQAASGMLKMPIQKVITEPIAPLVKTHWNQDVPYNNFCPQELSTGNRSVTGCVATAYAQLMYYHKWPERGSGSHSYSNETVGTVSADFSNSVYDWENMLTDYVSGYYTEEQGNAVALLMRDAGIAVDMSYSASASGAYSWDVPYALVNYFGYSRSTRFVFRDWYSTTEWVNLIVGELKAGRPMMYCGSSSGGGHAFICDGIDAEGKLHINWGWGGAFDGYFDMNVMSPAGLGIGGGSGNYIFNQDMVLGMQPANGTDTASEAQQVLANGGAYFLGETATVSRQDIPFYLSAVYNLSSRSLEDVMFAFAIYQDTDDKLLEILPSKLVEGIFEHGISGGMDVPLTISIPDTYADGIYKMKILFKEQKSAEWLPLIIPYQYQFRREWRFKVEGQEATLLELEYDYIMEREIINPTVSDKFVFQGELTSLKFTVKNRMHGSESCVLVAALFPLGEQGFYPSSDSLEVMLFDSLTVTLDLPITTSVPAGMYRVGILSKSNDRYYWFADGTQGELEVLDKEERTLMFFENFYPRDVNQFTCIDNDHNTPADYFAGLGFTDNTAWNILMLGENYLAFSHSGYIPVGTSDDWLITNGITIPDDVRLVFLRWHDVLLSDANYAAGEYSVYVSTTGNQISDFTDSPVFVSQPDRLNQYRAQQVLLENYRGKTIYIAFRNTSTNKNFVAIDDIQVYTYGTRPTLKGDVNGDGVIDIKDIRLLEAYISGSYSTLPEPDLADMNDDGVVDIADLQLLNVLLNGWQPTSDMGEGVYSEKEGVWMFTSSSAIGAFQLEADGELTFSEEILEKLDGTYHQNRESGNFTYVLYALSEEGAVLTEPTVFFSGDNVSVTNMKFVDVCGRYIPMREETSVCIAATDKRSDLGYVLEGDKLIVRGAQQLALFDLSGRLLVRVQGEVYNLNGISSGTYVVVANTPDGIKHWKIVR